MNNNKLAQIESEVLAEHLQAWEIGSSNESNGSHLLGIARTMSARCRAHSRRLKESDSEFEQRLRRTLGVVRGIQIACNQFVRAKGIVGIAEEKRVETALQRLPEKERIEVSKHTIWHPASIELEFREGDDYLYAFQVDVKKLGEAVGEYLECDWMQDDTLELMMLDALMYSRVSELGNKIKSDWPGFSIFGTSANTVDFVIDDLTRLAKGNHDKLLSNSLAHEWLAGIRPLLLFGLFAAIPTFLALYAAQRGWLVAAGVGLALYSVFAISIGLGRIARQFTNDSSIWHWRRLVLLRAEAVSIYSRIWETALSPRTLRDLMIASEDRGACWPMASYTLLESMMRRRRIIKDPRSPSWLTR